MPSQAVNARETGHSVTTGSLTPLSKISLSRAGQRVLMDARTPRAQRAHSKADHVGDRVWP